MVPDNLFSYLSLRINQHSSIRYNKKQDSSERASCYHLTRIQSLYRKNPEIVCDTCLLTLELELPLTRNKTYCIVVLDTFLVYRRFTVPSVSTSYTCTAPVGYASSDTIEGTAWKSADIMMPMRHAIEIDHHPFCWWMIAWKIILRDITESGSIHEPH
ncbi:hypothetical protein NPIL_38681 [Nephila pilipes]|uniref:Uncharacterized protein n=1 Tax=Nephila pilipes TaxID=299642 RepID=A0A8X6QXX9_NEPPI|nr:hypothetical protein NPIL_38681 [Nephila pilipes]